MIETRFKQTDIGLVPDDWDVNTIGKMASVTTGCQNTQDKDDNGKYPFYVRSPQVEKIDRYVFDTEGVVTAGDGVGTGKVFHYVNGKFGLHQRCYLIYNYSEKLNCKFFYWLFSQRFYERVHSMTAKSSVDSVRRDMITEMQIPLPPTVEEQERIAETLSDVDGLLRELDGVIAKKRAIKQGAMQELLTGKRRLEGFTGEWEEKKLGKVVDFQRGQVLTSAQYVTGNVPVVAGGKTFAGYHNKPNRKGKTICISASGAYAGFVSYYEIPIFASDCSTIGEGKNYDIRFVYYFLLAHQDDIYKMQTGGAQPHIHPKDVAPMDFHYPKDIEEQTAIANILSDMDEEIAALEAKRAKYEQVKQGMMQELLTGRIRLIENQSESQENKKLL